MAMPECWGKAMGDSKTHTSQRCVSAFLAVALLTATMLLPCVAPSQGYAQKSPDDTALVEDAGVEYQNPVELGVKPDQFHVGYDVVTPASNEAGDMDTHRAIGDVVLGIAMAIDAVVLAVLLSMFHTAIKEGRDKNA